MGRWWPLFLLCFCLGDSPAAPVAAVPTANRWLLIVDTSRGMQRRAEAAGRIAANLVASEMQGQMRPGDTLGLWTYNSELNTGVFPLQVWGASSSNLVARRVFAFLQEQKNENESRLDRVGPELMRLIKDSDFITITIISDGSSSISGTPHDAEINGSFKAWRDQQQKSQMPFITLLRAKHGVITDFAVNTPPFPLEFPPLPEELQKPLAPPAAVATPPAVEKSKPVTTLPPLIITGKKAEKAESESAAFPVIPIEPKTELIKEPLAAKEPVVQSIQNPAVSAVPLDSPASVQPTPTAPAPVIAEPAPTAVSSAPGAPPVPIQSAVAIKTEPKRKLWLGVGFGAAVVLAGVLFFATRRRPSGQASLITRSLDRDRK